MARRARAALPSAEELGLAGLSSMFVGSVAMPRVGAFGKESFESLGPRLAAATGGTRHAEYNVCRAVPAPHAGWRACQCGGQGE